MANESFRENLLKRIIPLKLLDVFNIIKNISVLRDIQKDIQYIKEFQKYTTENIEFYTQKRAICREDIYSRVYEITNHEILYDPNDELINQVSQVYGDNLISYIGNPESTDGNYITRTITEFNMPSYSPPILFFDKEDIFPLTTVVFEGHEYNVPKNSLKFLTMYYNGNPFNFPNSFDTHDYMINEHVYE
ncbi:MAG: LicD family protein [Brevinema sp.]